MLCSSINKKDSGIIVGTRAKLMFYFYAWQYNPNLLAIKIRHYLLSKNGSESIIVTFTKGMFVEKKFEFTFLTAKISTLGFRTKWRRFWTVFLNCKIKRFLPTPDFKLAIKTNNKPHCLSLLLNWLLKWLMVKCRVTSIST